MAVVDASVWVSALHEKDRFHAKARDFLERLYRSKTFIRIPAIAPAEVASSIRRATSQPRLAREAVEQMYGMEPEIWVIDELAAREAAGIASRLAVRGADSFYLWYLRLLPGKMNCFLLLL